MNFCVLTLFPDMVQDMVRHSILGRAVAAGHVSVESVNMRDFAVNAYGQVDDAPYGGGAGMVLMAPPVYGAYCHVRDKWEGAQPLPVVYLSPQGRVLDQAMAQQMAAWPGMMLLCGHYEGIDQRVLDEIVTHEVSIGDYVLTGGEPAALVVMDAISRLLPGVLGKEESHRNESFSPRMSALLEHPHYTRPALWRERAVPPVLLSGHHGEIEKWRQAQSLATTRQKRPELLDSHDGGL